MRRALLCTLFAAFVLANCVGTAPAPVAPTTLFKVGLVTAPGPNGPGSFNALAIEGARAAAEAGGAEFEAREAATPREVEAQLQALAAEGFGHLVVGPPAADALAALADRRRDLTFSIVDFSFDPALPNTQGLIFREDQAGYLAGALAGIVTESEMVGVAAGRDVPRVRKYVNGFTQGVRAVCPACQVLSLYTGAEDEPEAGEAAAREQIAVGADVIFGVDGETGAGAIREAARLGALAIGAETDAYLTLFAEGDAPGADRVLTSAVKRVDAAVQASVTARLNGTFAAGTLVFEAANGGLGLAPFHEAEGLITDEVRQRLAEIEAGLADGSIETGVSVETGGLRGE